MAAEEPVARRGQGWALLLFLGASLVVLAAGGLVTRPAIEAWYVHLAKPPWTPPNGVFGPAWAILYAMMAVAAWLVWRQVGWAGARTALVLYGAQLVLNCAWSFLFFGLRSPLAGLLDILPLRILIGATMTAFFRIRPMAGWLMLPYWMWVAYAGALNLAIWLANP